VHGLKKDMKTTSMAGVLPEIQTKNLPNTCLRTLLLNLRVHVFRVYFLIFRIIILTKLLHLRYGIKLFDIKITFKVDRHQTLKSVHDRITLSLRSFENMLLTSKVKIIGLSN
jgi:hypothetical protein